MASALVSGMVCSAASAAGRMACQKLKNKILAEANILATQYSNSAMNKVRRYIRGNQTALCNNKPKVGNSKNYRVNKIANKNFKVTQIR
jgi:hypothetical protein